MKRRLLIGLISFAGLVGVYIMQKSFDQFGIWLGGERWYFYISRLARYLVNDFLMIAIIYSLFQERKYVIFSLIVQLSGFVLILMPYLMIRLWWPQADGPLISFLHRLTVNPFLMILLIPAFWYQKYFLRKHIHEE